MGKIIDLTDYRPLESNDSESGLEGADQLEPTAAELEAEEQRLEIVPMWLRSWPAFRQTVTAAVSRQLHRLTYHLTHLPVYYLRIARRAPWGLWRTIAWLALWAADRTERADEIRQAVIADKRSNVAYNYSIDHRRSIVGHTITVIVGLTVASAGATAAYQNLSVLELFALVAVVVFGFGLIGRDWSTPVVDTAVKVHKTPPLTPDLIVAGIEAVDHSGISKAVNRAERMVAKGRQVAPPVALVEPVKQTRTGAGYATKVALPPGVPAAEVVPKAAAFAGAIVRPVDTVFLSADPDDEAGILSIFVANRALRKTKPRSWPLLTKGRTNFFEPIPAGIDVKGEAVSICWHEKSAVIGAIPGMGKTVVIMTVFAGLALDPRTELHLHFKGGRDGKALERVAHYFRAGDDPDDIKALRNNVVGLVQETKRRYQVLGTLDDRECPDGSVTDELASRRDLGLHPIILGLDECQSYYTDPVYGDEIRDAVEYLVRRARQANIIVIQATQKPNDESLPTNIRDNVPVRIGFYLRTRYAAEMTLGEGLAERGIRPHKDLTPADKGISWLLEEDNDRLMRWDFIPAPRLAEVVERARQMRERQNRLTGHAAGEDPNPDTDDSTFIDHVAQVWPAGRTWLWNSEIAQLLAASLDAYHGIGTKEVGARLNAAGLDVRGLNRKNPTTGETANKSGITLDDLTAAVEAQEEGRNLDEIEASYEDHDEDTDDELDGDEGWSDVPWEDIGDDVAPDADHGSEDIDEDIPEDTDEDIDPDAQPGLRVVEGGDFDAR